MEVEGSNTGKEGKGLLPRRLFSDGRSANGDWASSFEVESMNL